MRIVLWWWRLSMNSLRERYSDWRRRKRNGEKSNRMQWHIMITNLETIHHRSREFCNPDHMIPLTPKATYYSHYPHQELENTMSLKFGQLVTVIHKSHSMLQHPTMPPIQTKQLQHEEGSRAIMVNRLTEENTQLYKERARAVEKEGRRDTSNTAIHNTWASE